MNIEQQKKLYEEGNHICVRHGQGGSTELRDGRVPDWDWNYAETHYHWIHRNHTYILEAFLEGCDIYWYNYAQEKYHKIDDFVSNYGEGSENWQFIAVPKSLENCYCEPSTLHSIKLGEVDAWSEARGNEPNDKIYCIAYDLRVYVYNAIYQPKEYKQIEYNEQLQNWIYCPKEN